MPMKEPYPTIAEVGAALEAWAQPGFAASYDNVGLHVGDGRRRVRCAIIALDLTPDVLEEAIGEEATLIVTHHPLLFHPLRKITADDFTSNLALRLAESRIALYSIHTNLDAAPGGVSIALAALLGLEEVRFLTPEEGDASGFGAIGRLAEPVTLDGFLRRVAESLQIPCLRYAGDDNAVVGTVAVCGGSGASLIPSALAAGADAYVTADASYHKFFEVLAVDGHPAMALIDAGHYETEAHAEDLLRAWLADQFPAVRWLKTAVRTSPVRTFVA